MSLKIALLGFGTVASGLPFLLEENGDKIKSAAGEQVQISKILIRNDAEKARLNAMGYEYQFVTSIDEILSDSEISIVVELIGRIEPARTYILKALQAGKHVVTANKDLIALHGKEMRDLAETKALAFYYEAAVAGGIPILRTLANSFTSDKIQGVLGVLNGTSNFMMTKMVEAGWSYEEALAKAQALGYAESDPTNDVEGVDAAYKVAILSQFAFGMSLDFKDVSHQGISTITAEDVAVAQQLGYVIKLVGRLEEKTSGVWADVSPTFIPETHPLANVNDVMNAVFVESVGIGQSMFYGPGAGQKPTATSVMADIIRIAQRLKEGTVGKPFNAFQRPVQLAEKTDQISRYYMTINTPKQNGQLLRLVSVFSDQGVSCQQVLEQELDDNRARLVIMTRLMNQLQLEAIKQQISQESDWHLLNVFKVLGDDHDN
ncbi:homoserine dehydrogenase [Streptococcus pseudoporcinus]|uniref:Homoserine dehydrogenase n=1 Tax=Streptococcus pseudoporcinus TaxID=361101 RepID=A0A4U9XL68_9STRE|nr:homoserine dehydrogenase [Streptococcus pseudoporcinus]VTS14104.1 homoserine dehydrogenase [Streptococcus pseudoporcinus]VUC67010.1 homoserine dehydrogenase [Streptococcus pseudoporcinus]VUC97938.1 homoserine dehydrogenase [Streptococcus pseudoporcinus]VUC98330.1 homoserine dehydrogenase [Streptococcus pseudoporcinus]